jgi:hypothetical protein
VAQKAVQPEMRIIICLILALGILAPAQAWAAGCSNPQVRKLMDDSAQNRLLRTQAGIANNWQPANSFNSMYCSAQILNNFNSIGSALSNGIFSMIQGLLTNLMNQACQAAVAPIQNAASKLCIPSFSLPSFSLNLPMNRGFCNGMQLLTVNPIYGTPYMGNMFSPSSKPFGP